MVQCPQVPPCKDSGINKTYSKLLQVPMNKLSAPPKAPQLRMISHATDDQTFIDDACVHDVVSML